MDLNQYIGRDDWEWYANNYGRPKPVKIKWPTFHFTRANNPFEIVNDLPDRSLTRQVAGMSPFGIGYRVPADLRDCKCVDCLKKTNSTHPGPLPCRLIPVQNSSDEGDYPDQKDSDSMNGDSSDSDDDHDYSEMEIEGPTGPRKVKVLFGRYGLPTAAAIAAKWKKPGKTGRKNSVRRHRDSLEELVPEKQLSKEEGVAMWLEKLSIALPAPKDEDPEKSLELEDNDHDQDEDMMNFEDGKNGNGAKGDLRA